jgi:hypothetical protein
MKKVCSKCKEEKDISEFHKNKSNKPSGLSYCCKICDKTQKKESTKKYTEKWRVYKNLWADNNREKVNAITRLSMKKRRVIDLETVKAINQKWRKNNPKKIKENNNWNSINLTDAFIAQHLSISVKEFRELPEEVQKIYRTSIKIHRVFKQQKEKQVL